jgi:hypothetical protein
MRRLKDYCVTAMKAEPSYGAQRRVRTRRFIIIAATIPVLAVILPFGVPSAKRIAKGRAESIACGNYVVSIMYAGRMWANDNNGSLPPTLLAMSNELNSPNILRCPGDHNRQRIANWAEFTEANSSYYLLSPSVQDADNNTVYLRCKVHGHLGYPDATVFDGKERRTKKLF